MPEPGSQASGLDLLFRTVTLTVSEITRVERKSIDVVVLECDTWYRELMYLKRGSPTCPIRVLCHPVKCWTLGVTERMERIVLGAATSVS